MQVRDESVYKKAIEIPPPEELGFRSDDHFLLFSTTVFEDVQKHPSEREMELVQRLGQAYAKFPTAWEIYVSLIGRKLVGSSLIQTWPKNQLPAEFRNRIIVLYGSIHRIGDSDIFGFMALSFDEQNVIKEYFIPFNARLGSRYYALCVK